MKLFLDYISKIKFYIILQLFPVMLAEIIFFLYQLQSIPTVLPFSCICKIRSDTHKYQLLTRKQ